MVERQVDILIVGGGLTGAILMLALANKGYTILLIDNHPLSAKIDAHFDARTLALSPASLRILQMLDVWPLLQNKATPIETIHVSEQYRFGSTTLNSESANKPLGHVVEMQSINHALYQRLDEQHCLAPAKLIALDKDQGLATVSTEKEIIRLKRNSLSPRMVPIPQ